MRSTWQERLASHDTSQGRNWRLECIGRAVHAGPGRCNAFSHPRLRALARDSLHLFAITRE